MKLLRYDTRNVRSFKSDGDFIKPDGFFNNLLPLARELFANSSSLNILPKQMSQCSELAEYLSAAHSNIIISWNEHLEMVFAFEGVYASRRLDRKSAEKWHDIFMELCGAFSLYNSLGKDYDCKSKVEEFFSELEISIPKGILRVRYTDNFYFIPFEFLDMYVYIEMKAGQNALCTKNLKQVSIHYDPDLHTAESESRHTVELLKLRNFRLNYKDPELLLVSTHSSVANGKSYLINEELEKRVRLVSPKLAVFNSCIIAHQPAGLIQHFLDKGSLVIASPFFTLCSKTIFSPLLRFLEKDVLTAFFLIRIFYPDIYKYFRIYIPYRS